MIFHVIFVLGTFLHVDNVDSTFILDDKSPLKVLLPPAAAISKPPWATKNGQLNPKCPNGQKWPIHTYTS